MFDAEWDAYHIALRNPYMDVVRIPDMNGYRITVKENKNLPEAYMANEKYPTIGFKLFNMIKADWNNILPNFRFPENCWTISENFLDIIMSEPLKSETPEELEPIDVDTFLKEYYGTADTFSNKE